MNRFFGATALALSCALAACGSNEEPTPAEIEAAAEAAAISVRVVRVNVEPVQNWVYSQGTARAVRREFLSFESAGRVAYVNPNLKIGRPVRRDQIIAYQQTTRSQAELTGARSDLSVAKASQSEAAAQLELARATFERYRILLAQDSASKQEYDEAKTKLAQARAAATKANAQARASAAQVSTAQVTVSESRIVSPISGVLARLNIEKGRYFSPQAVNTQNEQGALSTVPAVVIDPSSYEITIDLPSYAFRQIATGADTLIVASQAPTLVRQPSEGAPRGGSSGPPVPIDQINTRGRVDAISPSLDPDKRTFQAKIRTTSGALNLQDGEFVSVWIAGREVVNALTVPFESLRYKTGQAFLFVYDPKTKKVAERKVQLGVQGANGYAVQSGLNPNDLVVTEGRAGLSNGDRVRLLKAAPAKRAPMPTPTGTATPKAVTKPDDAR